jgi:superfamily II DNA/RNA helicase
MIAPFMKVPAIVEVEELEQTPIVMHQQLLYNVPNFLTKVNLLNLFMYDEEVFTKSIIFINNRATAEKVYQSMSRRMHEAVGYLNPHFDEHGFASADEFKANDIARAMIVVTEEEQQLDLSGIPFLIHFDLPQDKETYIQRITNTSGNDDTIALSFATDLELSFIKKVEQVTGKKMEAAALPDDLVIVNDAKPKEEPAKKNAKSAEPEVGSAFHEKKPSNNKNYNFSSGQKAKMNKKKKHG